MDAVLGGPLRQRFVLLQELLDHLGFEGRRGAFPHHSVQSILFRTAKRPEFLGPLYNEAGARMKYNPAILSEA